MIPYDIEKKLTVFGLTNNEAKVYLTLISHGPLSAKEISIYSNVPYSKIYTFLKGLIDRGWIVKSEGKPILFSAVSPKEALGKTLLEINERFRREYDSLVNYLQPIFEAKSLAERPDIWIIYGVNNITSKIKEVLSKAEREILFAIHTDMGDINQLLVSAIENGIHVRVLVSSEGYSETLRYIGKSNLRYRELLFGGGIIIDEKEAMLTLGKGSDMMAIWATHMGLVEIATLYFNVLWDTAEEIRR
jgi:sugar-specific transcriptional regulator TrmB